MVNLRLPKLDAPTPEGQIKQLHAYLYQMVGELLVALTALDNENKELKEAIERGLQK